MLRIEFTGNETTGELEALGGAVSAYIARRCSVAAPIPSVINMRDLQVSNPNSEGGCVGVVNETSEPIDNGKPVSIPEPPVTQAIPVPPAVPAIPELPAAPVTQVIPPPPVVSEELDIDGKPWDPKLHSTAKTKTVDGRWKFLRGLDPALRNGATAPAQVPPPPETAAPVPEPPAHNLPWFISQCTAAGKTKADIDAALKLHGLNNVADLLQNTAMIDIVAGSMGIA